jgi:hypothetical protein
MRFLLRVRGMVTALPRFRPHNLVKSLLEQCVFHVNELWVRCEANTFVIITLHTLRFEKSSHVQWKSIQHISVRLICSQLFSLEVIQATRCFEK